VLFLVYLAFDTSALRIGEAVHTGSKNNVVSNAFHTLEGAEERYGSGDGSRARELARSSVTKATIAVFILAVVTAAISGSVAYVKNQGPGYINKEAIFTFLAAMFFLSSVGGLVRLVMTFAPQLSNTLFQSGVTQNLKSKVWTVVPQVIVLILDVTLGILFSFRSYSQTVRLVLFGLLLTRLVVVILAASVIPMYLTWTNQSAVLKQTERTFAGRNRVRTVESAFIGGIVAELLPFGDMVSQALQGEMRQRLPDYQYSEMTAIQRQKHQGEAEYYQTSKGLRVADIILGSIRCVAFITTGIALAVVV